MPMLPEAPARLSTRTGCFRRALRRCPTMRATVSEGPPGGKGMIHRIGFDAAARELGVSPPAVTHMIAALEHALGVALLRRDSRHLSLTPDGEQFLPAAMTALAELHAAEARLSVNRSRNSGKLVVGIGRTVSGTN